MREGREIKRREGGIDQQNPLNPFRLGTLLQIKLSLSDDQSITQIQFRTSSNQDSTMVMTKYKVYCGEQYIADDIGTYLEGGRDKCQCGHVFHSPTQYQSLELKLQSDGITYHSVNYQNYELQTFSNLQTIMQKYGGIPGPERFNCYISFDKNEVQNDMHSNHHLIHNIHFGYPYDSFKTA